MKVQYIFVTIGLLIGISADDNFECRVMDFNQMNSISLFEECPGVNKLAIKAFADNPTVTPYNEDSVNYLSNTEEGWSCFTTIDHFTLEEESIISSAIFLQSVIFDDMSQVDIEVIDMDDEGSAIPVINTIPTNTFIWTPFNLKFERNVANAKISIRAFVTTAARLAIQYLKILNPRIDESLCVVEDDTTTEVSPTEEPTTEDLTTEEPTTEDPTTEDPTTEEPTTEDPTTEEPTTEDPTTEEPTTEDPTTEEPTTEEPTTEEPTTEEPTTEEPTTEEPTTEEPTTEEPTTEDPTTEEPTTEDPTTEDPTTEDPTTEDPTTEDPTTEEPTTEEPTTEEPTTEEPTTEEPTTEEPTTEEPTTEVSSTEGTSTPNPAPPNSNGNKVWIITSFVFFLTTIGLMAGLIYLIYLYKTALAAKTAMLSAARIQPMTGSLPRLTVATSSQGDQIIIGIGHIKQS